MAKDKFLEATAELSLEADKLTKGLDESVAKTKAAVGKMQTELSGLNTTLEGVSGTSDVTSQAISALGASAAATGSRTLASAAAIATMGDALRKMGGVASTARAQLLKMAAAAKAFIATPLGVTLTAVAVVLGAVTWAWRAANKEQKEANALAEESKQIGIDRNREFHKTLENLRRQRLIAQGKNVASDFLDDSITRRETKALEADKLDAIRRKAEATEDMAIKERVRSLERETRIIQGLASKYDTLTFLPLKHATIAFDEAVALKAAAEAQKSLTDAAKREADARRQALADTTRQEAIVRRQARDARIDTPGEARFKIGQTLDAIKSQKTELDQIRREMQALMAEGLLSQTQAEALSSKLGLGLFGKQKDTTKIKSAGDTIAASSFLGGSADIKSGGLTKLEEYAKRQADNSDELVKQGDERKYSTADLGTK